MISFRLYPRLPGPIANALADSLVGARPADVEPSAEHAHAIFAPTGGSPVTVAELIKLRERVVEIARTLGFPSTSTQESRRAFDASITRLLYETMGISPHEASRDEIWQFIACVLLPDLTIWRWRQDRETFHRARFLGGVRNTFGRLWWRAEILCEHEQANPWELVEQLGEDELVQIMERPLLMGWSTLSRITARELLTLAEDGKMPGPGSGVTRPRVLRETQKRLLRWAAVLAIDMMTADQVRQRVRIELLEALAALIDAANKQEAGPLAA